jgi:hypothetical protein
MHDPHLASGYSNFKAIYSRKEKGIDSSRDFLQVNVYC